jgi:hypothetical protein
VSGWRKAAEGLQRDTLWDTGLMGGVLDSLLDRAVVCFILEEGMVPNPIDLRLFKPIRIVLKAQRVMDLIE